MDESGGTTQSLTFEQLVGLREKTEAVAQLLQTRLLSHLETLRPLFSPQRLLGKFAGAKDEVVGSEKTWTQLRVYYQEVCKKPFALVAELEQEPLARIENRLELYPWEYSYEAQGAKETKLLTMTAPVRWVLSYSSGYTLSQLRSIMATQRDRSSEPVRQFVVNALVMRLVFEKYPGLAQLFGDLRYEVRNDTCPGLGELRCVTVNSCLPSFRPADELMLLATRFSGVPAFIELLDTAAVATLQDPLKSQVEQVLLT
jgi:hypothetical protein